MRLPDQQTQVRTDTLYAAQGSLRRGETLGVELNEYQLRLRWNRPGRSQLPEQQPV